jgi:hypothetical protein
VRATGEPRQISPAGEFRQTLYRTGKRVLVIAAKIYDRLSYIDYMTGRSIPYAALRGLNLAEMAGPSPILTIAYANMSAFHGSHPD